MRATTVRFGDDLWELLEREAGLLGVSTAQLIRDAAILRVAALAARRGDALAAESVEDLAERAGQRRRAAREVPGAVGDRERVAAVRGTNLLDAPSDPVLDRLADMARKVLRAPVALVSLVDEERQFFTSCLGLEVPFGPGRETPLSHSFCQHVVASREPLLVEDARKHPVLRTNLAIEDLGVAAYAGVPLIVDDQAVGSLCVIDTTPRVWTREQVDHLATLAEAAAGHLRLRRAPVSG